MNKIALKAYVPGFIDAIRERELKWAGGKRSRAKFEYEVMAAAADGLDTAEDNKCAAAADAEVVGGNPKCKDRFEVEEAITRSWSSCNLAEAELIAAEAAEDGGM